MSGVWRIMNIQLHRVLTRYVGGESGVRGLHLMSVMCYVGQGHAHPASFALTHRSHQTALLDRSPAGLPGTAPPHTFQTQPSVVLAPPSHHKEITDLKHHIKGRACRL
jgi:hypothetical protein